MDLSAVHSQSPALCDDARTRPLGAHEPAAPARELDLAPETLERFSIRVPKDPDTLPRILKQGPEAVGYYVSFRTDPQHWGVYLREAGVRALKEEYHRIIWRDLGKYVDKPMDDVVDRIGDSPVPGYPPPHPRVPPPRDH